MSDTAEEFARQLLEKTEGGKLRWYYVPTMTADNYWIDSENYRTDLEDDSSFSITRRTNGDNKMLLFELTQPGRVILSAQADNFPSPPNARIWESVREALGGGDANKLAEPVDAFKIARFRLFSDLFYAARKDAVGGDQTIARVQQLLERLG